MNISKILLVDDDPNIRFIVQIGLEDVPEWTIIEAGSGFEAIEKAKVEHPDLILMDIMMPGMDGATTLEMLRKERITERIPVIFFTAKARNNEIDEYPKHDILGVISKPFDPLKLSSCIQNMVQASETLET